MVRQQPLDLGQQRVRFGEVDQADGTAADLVLVRRADAALGGADPDGRVGVLAQAVELAVDRQDQRRGLGDPEDFGGDRHPLPAQFGQFGDQMVRIDDDAVADQRQLAANHARRQQAQLVADAVDDQRVAGIVPALVAHDDVGPLGQPVDDLALAFVAPLRPDDDHVCHCLMPLPRPRRAG